MEPKSNFDNLDQCYRILGLHPTASIDEIKKKYRQLAKAFHPDSYQDSHSKEKAAERFREITEAYKTIINWKHFEEAFKKAEKSVSSEPSVKASKSNKRNSYKSYSKEDYSRTRANDPKKSDSSNLINLIKRHRNLDKRTLLLTSIIIAFVFLIINYDLFTGKTPTENKEKTPVKRSKPIVVSSEPQQLKSSDTKNSPYPSADNVHSGIFFTIGSPEDEVLKVQGPPDRKTGQVWHYGLSRVTFRDGKVVGYDNFDNSLKVKLFPRTVFHDEEIPQYFTLGSSEDVVLIVQGTPSRVARDVWYYGLDRVFFKEDQSIRLVNGYDNISGSLKIKIIPQAGEPSVALKRGYFTVGDSPDDVLALQGMPQKVERNKWFYGAFYVIFDRGKVLNVGPVPGDGGGVLKFLAKQPPTQNGVENGR